jgi:apolipoprotein N-acyltransferase
VKTLIQKYLYRLKPTSLAQKPLLIKGLIVFLSGVVCSFALLPYGLWPLFYLGFSVFFLTLSGVKTKKISFFYGWLFGLGYFLFGLNWIGNALLVEGNEFWWVWPLAVIALPIALAIFTGLSSFMAFMLNKKRKAPLFISLCLMLALTEYARGHLFTGFPWNLFGYIWSDTLTIAQSTSLIGPYGLTFITLLWAIIPITLITGTNENKKTFVVSCLSILGLMLYGRVQLSTPITFHANFQVQIVQPNIKQSEKWKLDKLGINFNQLTTLSTPQERAEYIPTAIIWPETALAPNMMNSPAVQERINSILTKHAKGSTLLTGALAAKFDISNHVQYFNNITAIKENTSPLQIYAKSHLVPFGEYIPFADYIPIKTITQFNGFAHGKGAQKITISDTPSFSPMICYEVIFPSKIVNKEHRPDWLLNVTNDGWYGKSAGPYQHFAQSRFRSIEQGLPLVRSANTGISGIIDPFGRVIASQDLMEQGLIVSKLPNPRPPTFYSKHGNSIFLILMLSLLSLLLFYKRRQ